MKLASSGAASRLSPLAILAVLGLALAPLPTALADDGASGLSKVLASPLLPATGLYASSLGQEESEAAPLRMNLDIMAGAFFSGYGWMGDADHEVNSDIGGMVDLSFNLEVFRFPLGPTASQVLQIFPLLGLYKPQEMGIFVGGEFSYAGHGMGAGPVYLEGNLNRFYFLAPIDIDFPLDPNHSLLPIAPADRNNPASFRFGIAPGVQIASPDIDDDAKQQAEALGLEVEEDAAMVFDLRIRIQFRMPINPDFAFLVEAAYDWAELKISGPETSLSDLGFLLGFSFIF